MNEFDLTDVEADFFAEGDAMLSENDSFADLDNGYQQPSLWQRIFSRTDSDE